MLNALCIEIASTADEAMNFMNDNNTNAAIGTLVYARDTAELIDPLMKIIMALHRLPSE